MLVVNRYKDPSTPLPFTDLIRKVVIARHEAILNRTLVAIVVRLLARKSGQAVG